MMVWSKPRISRHQSVSVASTNLFQGIGGMCRPVDMTTSPSKGIYSVVVGRPLTAVVSMANIFFPRASLIEMFTIIEYLLSNTVEYWHIRVI